MAKRNKGGNQDNGESTAGTARGGVPAPEWECEEGLRRLAVLVEAGTDDSVNFFYAGFVPILDAVLSKLIEWTEATGTAESKKQAGRVLADRVRFLSAQISFWQEANIGFGARWEEFGDLRGARTPETSLAWWAGDYLRELVSLRSNAHLYLSPMGDNDYAIADKLPDFVKQKEWLERLIALPNFDEKSWREWATAVFDRMSEDEGKIRSRKELKGKQTRDSQERMPTGEFRLYDLKKTIDGAVRSLARKPVGTVRGITRPSS